MKQMPLEQRDAGVSAGTASTGVIVAPASTLPSLLRMRLADYCILGKVRISVLVLIVTAVGFCMGARGPVSVPLLLHTLIGTCLVAIAANTLNQYMERDFDRLMIRTADRPIPAGRMTPNEALVFGAISGVLGTAYLLLFVNLWAVALAAATILLYLFAYTPLKRLSAWNTWVGAVPGALPPLIGFAAARQSLDAMAWTLFAVLFVWQLPHFFAIAWMYREDYARGGYLMLSTVDPTGRSTRRQTVGLTALLVPVTLLPWMLGFVGPAALLGATLAGVVLFGFAMNMARGLTHASARLMLLASVIYLPVLMMFYLLDRIQPN